jgi:hypothetical protein
METGEVPKELCYIIFLNFFLYITAHLRAVEMLRPPSMQKMSSVWMPDLPSVMYTHTHTHTHTNTHTHTHKQVTTVSSVVALW